MNDDRTSRRQLVRQAWIRLLIGCLLIGVCLFLPARTWAYWQAWVYLIVFLSSVLAIMVDLLKHDPELLARRMRMKEKQPAQKRIITIMAILFMLTLLLSGWDKRFGWSHIPPAAVILGDIGVFIGYGFIFCVFKANRFASRIIEVMPGQTVISNGPYSWIRHPMYLGSVVMHIATPMALGSSWALIPAVLIVPVTAARILHEERLLAADLGGYREYMRNVRYRLIPGIW